MSWFSKQLAVITTTGEVYDMRLSEEFKECAKRELGFPRSCRGITLTRCRIVRWRGCEVKHES